MKTQEVPIAELQPGDQVFVPAPKPRAAWDKIPEILTVKEVFPDGVTINETGGLWLVAPTLNKVITEPVPVPVDQKPGKQLGLEF